MQSEPETSDLLATYLEHLEARLRLTRAKVNRRDGDEALAVLPAALASLCTTEPQACLKLITSAIRKVDDPALVRAIGEGLLQNLLNESSDAIADDVTRQLRTDKKFRQAFSCGEYASVDPAIIAGWVNVFESLGTSKAAERKSLWR